MTALLGAMRRERNGAVADAMRPVGTPYGLNYGVSLPTLRMLARAETPDYDFAKYLALQDVRELRLAAYHIADPARLTEAEYPFWGEGIVNSELAEEAAFTLLHRVPDFPNLFERWTAPDMPWSLQYAALMAASRLAEPDPAWIGRALETLHRAAERAGSAEGGGPTGDGPARARGAGGGGRGAGGGAGVGGAGAGGRARIHAADPLVLSEHVTDLSCACSDIACRNVCISADMFAELCHEALAECHDLSV